MRVFWPKDKEERHITYMKAEVTYLAFDTKSPIEALDPRLEERDAPLRSEGRNVKLPSRTIAAGREPNGPTWLIAKAQLEALIRANCGPALERAGYRHLEGDRPNVGGRTKH